MKNKRNIDFYMSYVAAVFLAMEFGLIFGSWLISSIFPDLHLRSVIGNEGIRWLLGHFADNMSQPPLVWIILLAMAFGAVDKCGILQDFKFKCRNANCSDFRMRLGLGVAAAEFLLVLLTMALLSLSTDAVLRSVEGNLFPSSFSKSVVPVFSSTLILCSTTYGIIQRRFRNVAEWFSSLAYGIIKSSMFVVTYVFAIQLYATINFVFR